MAYKINGPINLVRMEGTINGIDKVIYLFMDRHEDIERQTDCDDTDAIDIQEYLKNNFKNLENSDRTYDFFLETNPTPLAYKPEETIFYEKNYKLIYLEQVWKFFYESLKYDPKMNKLESLFRNIRLHYIDIRDIVYYFTKYMINTSIKYLHQLIKEKDYKKLQQQKEIIAIVIKTTIKIILDFFRDTLEILQNPESIKNTKEIIINKPVPTNKFIFNESIQKELYDRFRYLLNKLFNNYSHQNIQKITRYYIDNYLIPETKIIYNYLQELYSKVKLLKNDDYFQIDNYFREIPNKKFIEYLLQELVYINNYFINYLGIYQDLYFLRRFLDKDYITNAIVYTGAAHSIFYIYVLAHLGFQITHCAKCKMNVPELTDEIKNTNKTPSEKLLTDISDYFYVFNSFQCVDMSDFPKNFA